jgi:hypothetical protein
LAIAVPAAMATVAAPAHPTVTGAAKILVAPSPVAAPPVAPSPAAKIPMMPSLVTPTIVDRGLGKG